jgi:hypothetical protein
MLRLLAFVLLFAAAAPLHAQQRRPTAGFKAGTSVFTITGSDRSDFSPRAGLAAGLWLRYPLAGPLGVQAEALFLTKAVTVETQQDGADRPLEAELTYTFFEFPLLASLDAPGPRGARLRLTAGPHAARSNDAIVRARIGDGLGNAETDPTVSDWTYGLTAGVQATWPAGDLGALSAGVQVSSDLSNLRSADPPLHARGVFVYAGFAF